MSSAGPVVGGAVIRGGLLRHRDREMLATRLIVAGLDSTKAIRQPRAVIKDILYILE
jgi:hypothetical protein